jgi:hypothetical protein
MPPSTHVYSDERDLTISAGASISSSYISVINATAGLVMMPAAWTAASIAFYALDTHGILRLLYNGGALVQVNAPAVSLCYPIPLPVFQCLRVYLFSQNALGVAVVQAQDRIITVQLK